MGRAAGSVRVPVRQADGRQVAQTAPEGDHFRDAAARREAVGAVPPPATSPRPALGGGDERHAGVRHRAGGHIPGQRPGRPGRQLRRRPAGRHVRQYNSRGRELQRRTAQQRSRSQTARNRSALPRYRNQIRHLSGTVAPVGIDPLPLMMQREALSLFACITYL